MPRYPGRRAESTQKTLSSVIAGIKSRHRDRHSAQMLPWLARVDLAVVPRLEELSVNKRKLCCAMSHLWAHPATSALLSGSGFEEAGLTLSAEYLLRQRRLHGLLNNAGIKSYHSSP